MHTSDWVIVAATLLGPVLAVQAQKWIERARDRDGRKSALFHTLMGTRADRVSAMHVGALNMIDLAFYGRRMLGRVTRSKKEQAVLDAWHVYLDHLGSGPADDVPDALRVQWNTRLDDYFVNLLNAMALEVGYEFDRVQLAKEVYWPKAHGTQLQRRDAFERAAWAMLIGQTPLVVKQWHEPPADGRT